MISYKFAHFLALIAITAITAIIIFSLTKVDRQELKRIPQMIQDTKSQGKEFAKLYLFEDNPVRHTDIESLKDKSIDGIVLSLKNILHIDFDSPEYKYLEFRVPQIDSTYIDIELIRNDISFANTIIKNQDGEMLDDLTKGFYYRGIIKGDKDSLAAISFSSKGEISGFVSTPSEGDKYFSVLEEDIKKVLFYKDFAPFPVYDSD